MADQEIKQWLTVRQTAARLNTSEEMVRRKIREGDLPASRLTEAAKAPWMIDAAELERQLDVASVHENLNAAGIVTGRGDELFAKVAARHGEEVAQRVRDIAARRDLFDRVEREMADDPTVREQLERLDDDEKRFEEEARELARRIERSERLRERALELLGEQFDAR